MLANLLLYCWNERDRLPTEVTDRLAMPDVVPKVTDKFISLMEALDRQVKEDREQRDAGVY